MNYNDCNSICTKNSEVIVGNKYQYYESMPSCIWDVELLEDNSDEKMVDIKLKVIGHIGGIEVKPDTIFNASMVRENIAFGGMWRLYEPFTYGVNRV